MAKSDQKKKKIEFEPDAWARFERAVDVVAKSPPQHRKKPKPKKKPHSTLHKPSGNKRASPPPQKKAATKPR